MEESVYQRCVFSCSAGWRGKTEFARTTYCGIYFHCSFIIVKTEKTGGGLYPKLPPSLPVETMCAMCGVEFSLYKTVNIWPITAYVP